MTDIVDEKKKELPQDGGPPDPGQGVEDAFQKVLGHAVKIAGRVMLGEAIEGENSAGNIKTRLETIRDERGQAVALTVEVVGAGVTARVLNFIAQAPIAKPVRLTCRGADGMATVDLTLTQADLLGQALLKFFEVGVACQTGQAAELFDFRAIEKNEKPS